MPRRTPQEKKRLEYDRDRYVEAENPHLFRKGWPKKKALASRRERRRGERLLEGLRNLPAEAVVEHAEDAALTASHAAHAQPGRWLAKQGVLTVRQRVAHRTARRVEQTGFNFFKQEYDSAAHRKDFAAFLTSVVVGGGPGSDALAAHLGRLLDPALRDPRTDAWRQSRRVTRSARGRTGR